MPTQTYISTETLNECLYDIIMGSIEPDLTLDMLPVLDEIYLDETPEEHAERMQRYAFAIQEFKRQSQEFTHVCKEEMTAMKKHAVSLAKSADASQNSQDIHSIEDSIEES
jgi:hypothetical protein